MMEIKSPKISIIMCNYNNAHYIEKAINSVIAQTLQEWELCLVEDCSTDNSLDIIKKYCEKEPRIKLYQNEINMGYGKSVAKNIALAKGEFAGILDPDDALTSDALEVMLNEFKKDSSLVGAYSQLWFCDKDLNPEKLSASRSIPEGLSYLEFGKMAMTHFFVFRRQKFIEYGSVDPSFRNSLDQDWYYKIEEIGKVKFVEKPLYYYRVSPTGISQGVKKRYMTNKDHLEIVKKAVARRNYIGKRKNRPLFRVKRELFYSKYRLLKEEKSPLAFVANLQSKWFHFLLKMNS